MVFNLRPLFLCVALAFGPSAFVQEPTPTIGNVGVHSESFDSQRSIANLRVEIALLQGQTATLKVMLDEREKQSALALSAAEKAILKAEEAQQRINVSQNEFRSMLNDILGNAATKDDVSRLNERIAALERALAADTGRSGGFGSASTVLFQVVPILLTILGLVWVIRERRRPTEG